MGIEEGEVMWWDILVVECWLRVRCSGEEEVYGVEGFAERIWMCGYSCGALKTFEDSLCTCQSL